MESLTACPICRHNAPVRFEDPVSRAQGLRYWGCSNCGAVFQSPRMDEAELAEYYRLTYRLTAQAADGPTPEKIAFERQRAQHLTGLILAHASRCDVHLDIGTGAGQLMRELRQRAGCRTYGIEPGEGFRRYARMVEGLDVYPTLEAFLDAVARRTRVDVVTLSHVLEHLPHPGEYLTRLRTDLLAEDGILVLEVPNLFVHTAFEPAHLFAFTRASLEELLQRTGYRPLMTKLHGVPRRDPRAHYLTVIAGPSVGLRWRRSKIFSTRAMRWRRRLGRSLLGLVAIHPRYVANGMVRRVILFTRRLPRERASR